MRAAKASPPPARAGNDNSNLFRSFDGLDTAPLIDYLAKWKAPFEKSQVYKVATEELILDETARVSSIRRTKDPVLFALCDKLLLDMTAGDQESLFVIHRTDASHIQYLPGGKFEKHRDYLSVTSNMIEEWTLLISVNKVGDAVRGGETKIDINALNSVISKASVTPGSALLFRKDLEHEGMLVKAGSKAILSLDVWKVVQADRQRRIVHVTFPKGERGGDHQEQPPGLQEISDSSFALPVTRVLLSSPVFRRFLLMQDYWSSESLILPFECREFNQAAFKPVFQVLSGGYVSREDAEKHRSALDFFGLELDSILVSMSNKANVKNEEELQWESGYVDDDDDDDVDDFDDDVDDEASSRKERRHVAPIDKKPISTDDLIICTSPEQTDVLADIVRSQRLPYLRFRAIFAEGRVRSNLQMVPCYLALGDHENILFLQTALEWDYDNEGDMHTLPRQNLVDALGAAEIAEIGLEEGKGAGVRETEEEQETTVAVGKSEYDLSALPGKLKTPNTRVQLVNFQVGRERSFSNYIHKHQDSKLRQREVYLRSWNRPKLLMSLMLGFQSAHWQLIDLLTHFFKEDDVRYVHMFDCVVLPGGNSTSTELPAVSDLFHYDEGGKSAFTMSEAARATEHFMEGNFVEQLRQRVSKTSFTFPQNHFNEEVTFCNMNVFAKVSFIEMTGLVRVNPKEGMDGVNGPP